MVATSLFGAYIKHMRGEQELTLRSLAEMVGVDPSSLSRLERGEVVSPSEELLDRLATELDRPRAEVYLAAGRITPGLASKLEQGMPLTVPQIGLLLSALEADLSMGFGALGGLSLEESTTEEDRATAGKIMECVNHIKEIGEAINRGELTNEQFHHVAENIRQLKLALVHRGRDGETP